MYVYIQGSVRSRISALKSVFYHRLLTLSNLVPLVTEHQVQYTMVRYQAFVLRDISASGRSIAHTYEPYRLIHLTAVEFIPL